MKTIVFTGDSHTWGQGVKGLIEQYDPPVCSGELRPVPFKYPCYVNLIRDEICKITNSSFSECECKILIDKPYTFDCDCNLVRLFFKCGDKPSICRINNKYFFIPKAKSDNSYKNIVLFLEDNEKSIEINPTNEVFLYRTEFYKGEYAVINSGIGSCTSERYAEEYYEDYVSAFKPSFIVAEAHSINDWLNKVPLETSNKALKYIALCHASNGCIPVILTVAPIAGSNSLPYNTLDYSLYIEESRKSAEQAKIILADANICMGNDKFSDNWHVDEAGHKVYAEIVMDVLKIYL